MIYYYSATGNTRYAAEYLGKRLDATVYDILDDSIPLPKEEETVGLMFPIYCWGIPPVMKSFVERMAIHFTGTRYLWAVCTCGDEAGLAMKTLDKMIEKNAARKADALFSLIMPNTYVLLPGFDVDSTEVEKSKIQAAPGRLDKISDVIKARESGIYQVKQGALPGLRSAVFPLFEKWGVTTKWWHVSKACIGCGRCAGRCPAKNITMVSGLPVWGNRCFSCCACFHCCPVKAISYSWFTDGKSQYKGI